MRELLNKFNRLLNETDYTSLKRRLSPELYESVINSNNSKQINESSLNRIKSFIDNHQCAVITAFRNQLVNCLSFDDDETKINIHDNKGRNKKLKAALLYMGYEITKVKGTYIENYMSENSVEVKEDSFFVVNLKNDPKFISNITKLGELFCQDSVLIFDLGNNYLYGTNNSDFPGLGNEISVGKFKPGIEGEFMTKVSGRPFTVESFDLLQINSKRIVSEIARPIVDRIR